MQFNSLSAATITPFRLWQKHGFQIIGRLPNAFLHPGLGYTDAFVMYREL